MTEISHVGAFDVLVLLESTTLTEPKGLTRPELSTLAYLACIGSMYAGAVASDWGYSFVRTASIGLTSSAIVATTDAMIATGILIRDHETLSLSSFGRDLLIRLRRQLQYQDRSRFLLAASDVLGVASIGIIKSAIDFEPTIRSSELCDRSDVLLDGAAAGLLYRELEAVANVIGLVQDVGVASTIYVDYLRSVAAREMSMMP